MSQPPLQVAASGDEALFDSELDSVLRSKVTVHGGFCDDAKAPVSMFGEPNSPAPKNLPAAIPAASRHDPRPVAPDPGRSNGVACSGPSEV